MADLAEHHTNFTDEQSDAGALLDMIVGARPKWQKDAACREHPEMSWFPTLGQNGHEAKRVCHACLVFWECQEWAGHQPDDLDGIWGGLSRRQRAKAHPAGTTRVSRRARSVRETPDF